MHTLKNSLNSSFSFSLGSFIANEIKEQFLNSKLFFYDGFIKKNLNTLQVLTYKI